MLFHFVVYYGRRAPLAPQRGAKGAAAQYAPAAFAARMGRLAGLRPARASCKLAKRRGSALSRWARPSAGPVRRPIVSVWHADIFIGRWAGQSPAWAALCAASSPFGLQRPIKMSACHTETPQSLSGFAALNLPAANLNSGGVKGRFTALNPA